MTNRTPSLDAFDVLVGTWTTNATHPTVDGAASGTLTFEWTVGGHFLLARATNDHTLFPDAIYVVGPPETGDGLVMEYFDSRGVRRTYGISLEEGVLRIWRDAPGFAQRFSATVHPEHFAGTWQLAKTPGEWRDDVRVSYRRSEPSSQQT